MNNYLFRGKIKDTNEWIYGGIAVMDGRYFILDVKTYDDDTCSWVAVEVQPETVGQWIGRIDKNGTKVFDGDLCFAAFKIPYTKDTYGPKLCKCEYNAFYGAFTCKNQVGRHYDWDVEGKIPELPMEGVEVIGNVYDNGDFKCPTCHHLWNEKHNTLIDYPKPCPTCGKFILRW